VRGGGWNAKKLENGERHEIGQGRGISERESITMATKNTKRVDWGVGVVAVRENRSEKHKRYKMVPMDQGYVYLIL
jgi:hypothetical protein